MNKKQSTINKELNNIICSWKEDKKTEEKHIMKGQYILEEDGWFEGIVKENTDDYIKESFVFGVYSPNNYIELLKVTTNATAKPLVFRGKKNDYGYNGETSLIEYSGEKEIGSNFISIEKSKEQETILLETKINKWKQTMQDMPNIILYEKYAYMRSELIDILNSQYIKEDIVKSNTQNNTLKLVKQKKNN